VKLTTYRMPITHASIRKRDRSLNLIGGCLARAMRRTASQHSAYRPSAAARPKTAAREIAIEFGQ
jgi:hypothetical protein